MQRTQFKQFSARLELTAWRFLEVEENEMEIAAAMQWLSKCQGMSAAFEMQQCEKFQQRNVWCSLSLIANVRCRWLLKLWYRFRFIFTFYSIFSSVTRSTVSVGSQFPSHQRKLRNVVCFDLYHAAVQHSRVNNKGKPNQSHRLACPTATLLFFPNLSYNQGLQRQNRFSHPVLL